MKFHRIQMLRTIAASLVIIDHALGVLSSKHALPSWINDFRSNIGDIGVDVFFMISGFIMINSSYDKFGSLASAMNFIKSRISRILPLYWIATTLFYVNTAHKFEPVTNYFKSLFFIPFLNAQNSFGPVLGIGWTLNYEMIFYAAFSISLLFPRKIGISLLLIAFAATSITGFVTIPDYGAAPVLTAEMFICQPVILLFAIGMILGLLAKNLHYPRSPKNSLVIITLALIIDIISIYVFRISAHKIFIVQCIIWIPLVLSVAVAIFHHKEPENKTELTLSHFGDASYCTYLFHLFVISIMKYTIPVTGLYSGVLFVGISVIAGNLVGLMIDETLGKWITNRARGVLRNNSGARVPSREIQN